MLDTYLEREGMDNALGCLVKEEIHLDAFWKRRDDYSNQT